MFVSVNLEYRACTYTPNLMGYMNWFLCLYYMCGFSTLGMLLVTVRERKKFTLVSVLFFVSICVLLN